MTMCIECRMALPLTNRVYCAGQYEGDCCTECAVYLGSVGFDTAMRLPRAGAKMPRVASIGYGHASNVLAILAQR